MAAGRLDLEAQGPLAIADDSGLPYAADQNGDCAITAKSNMDNDQGSPGGMRDIDANNAIPTSGLLGAAALNLDNDFTRFHIHSDLNFEEFSLEVTAAAQGGANVVLYGPGGKKINISELNYNHVSGNVYPFAVAALFNSGSGGGIFVEVGKFGTQGTNPPPPVGAVTLTFKITLGESAPDANGLTTPIEWVKKANLLPVDFKTFLDSEPGPDKAHKKNLNTRQNETAAHGVGWEKVVCKIWSSSGNINLIDFLDGGADNRTTYESALKWKVDGVEQTTHTASFGSKPDPDEHTHRYVEVLPKSGGTTIDRLIITIIPPETKAKFDAWYATESTAAGKAWFNECPPMPTRLEFGAFLAPDRFFNPRIWNDPEAIDTRFHPNAFFEIRGKKTAGGHGHQMCFLSNHDPILSGVSAGTADKAAAFYIPDNLDIDSHVNADVKPFVWAMQMDGNPCNQQFKSLTIPMLHEGAFIKKYVECRPVEPNAKAKFIPGSVP